jgi:hypothetical protein
MPNAASASRWAVFSACCSSVGDCDDTHAASAAARRRLDDHGIADVLRDLRGLLFALDGPSLPGRIGTPAFFMARRARALSPISG